MSANVYITTYRQCLYLHRSIRCPDHVRTEARGEPLLSAGFGAWALRDECFLKVPTEGIRESSRLAGGTL